MAPTRRIVSTWFLFPRPPSKHKKKGKRQDFDGSPDNGSRMKLLLTNDDGIDAPGIEALHQAASVLGEPLLVAPVTELSGCGHRVTTSCPVRLQQRHHLA